MLNIKNTLDGYLKNVEVIGNTVQDTNNLANIRSVGDKVEGQELYNISIQVDNGDGVSEVVEILSPVQLEKVGDVADKIVCKDGVWGVENNIKTVVLNGSEHWGGNGESNSSMRFSMVRDKNVNYDLVPSLNVILSDMYVKQNIDWNNDIEGIENGVNDLSIRVSRTRLSTHNVAGFKEWLKANNTLVKYQTQTPQFIPLPHDQQVKLRTFAGQTNIAFLTEIPGQIKAQVPKSLGATVNTHTEQITDLYNSLDRVKKLEETIVSTVETESGFTTVNETSNGYFEDVKLEGKTLVNLFDYNKLTSNSALTINGKKISVTGYSNRLYVPEMFACNKTYTIKGSNYTKSNSDILTNQGNILLVSKDNSISRTINVIDFNKTDVATLTIPSDYNPANYHGLYFYGSSGNTTSIENLIILEGDHTNNPPEYFEGLMSVGQDVEEVNVESVNGNVFDMSKVLYDKSINSTNGDIANAVDWCVNTNFIRVQKGITLFINRGNSVSNAQNTKGYIYVYQYNKDRSFYKRIDVGINSNSFTPNIDGFIRIASKYNELVDFGIYRREGANVLHQSNKKPLLYYNPTTETWEKPVLREWDTIEKHSDGKYYYHKRSGEVVLNGSESWAVSGKTNNGLFKTTYSVFLHNINTEKPNKNDGLLIPNNVQYIPTGYNDGVEGTYISNNNTSGSPIITYQVDLSKLSTQDVAGFKAWLKANPTTVVYKLAKEEVYECTNIDLMTYSGETNYIINSGAISPKSLLKVHNNIANVVKILQEKVSLLENTFIAGLKSVLSGDMYSLATILYPEDFEQNDNTEQDIMVIPE
jgi:hypothetical protein